MERIKSFLEPFKKNTSCKTFIIAEAGVHHDGSIEKAKELIDAAAHAGVDAIKFQTYKANTLVTYWAPMYWKHDHGEEDTQYHYFKKRDRFCFKDYQLLNDYAVVKGINFCSTPFDSQAVQWLNDLDVPFWKVASGDIDNYALLQELVKTQKPILLSTGASYFSEIHKTVDFLQTGGLKDLALLHCNLAYPTPTNEANLYRIPKLKNQFPGLIIGYSDHTIPDGSVAIPAMAAILGAQIIEKHFTLDRNQSEDDHYHSVDPCLLRKMIEQIRLAEEATESTSEVTDSEMSARVNARRSLIATTDIPKGSAIMPQMIIAKRPGGGISPSMAREILGRKVRVAISKDHLIKWHDLD